MTTQKRDRGLKGVADRLQDLAGGLLGKVAAQVAARDAQRFVTNAIISDIYEIEAAEIALRRSRSETIRKLAGAIIDDHMTSSHQLESTLRSMRIDFDLPKDADARRRKMLDNLRAASDEDFDDRYLEQQTLAHKEAMTLFSGYCEKGEDPRLNLFARATYPSSSRHLEWVRERRPS